MYALCFLSPYWHWFHCYWSQMQWECDCESNHCLGQHEYISCPWNNRSYLQYTDSQSSEDWPWLVEDLVISLRLTCWWSGAKNLSMSWRQLSWHNASRWIPYRGRQSNEVPTVCTVFSVPLATYFLFGSVTTCSQEWWHHLLYATFNVFTLMFINYTRYHVACVFGSPTHRSTSS